MKFFFQNILISFFLTKSVAAIPAFMAYRLVFIRERIMGFYEISAFVFAQSIVQIPFLLCMSVAYVFPTYYILGLEKKGAGVYFLFMFISLYYSEGIMLVIILFFILFFF